MTAGWLSTWCGSMFSVLPDQHRHSGQMNEVNAIRNLLVEDGWGIAWKSITEASPSNRDHSIHPAYLDSMGSWKGELDEAT